MDSMKSRMDDLFIFASQVKYIDKHPLRVVQASKSLIGIDLNSPPKILLKWLEYYVKDFIPNFNIQSLGSSGTQAGAITFAHLKNLILKKKTVESHIYLSYLLQVAGTSHIAEYLIELGVCKSPGSLLLCWSALRSIQFLGEKEGSLILYHCISKLLEEEEQKINSKKFLIEKYEIYCHQFQIRNCEMVRKAKIIPHLDRLVQSIEPELLQSKFPHLPAKLRKMIILDGSQGIICYLNSLKIEDISTELILLLDALRTILNFCDNREDPVLLDILNKCKGKAYAK